MKNNFRFIFKDLGIRYALLFSGVILLLQLGVLIFIYPKLPPLVPLFNSLSWGRQRLAPTGFIFAVPIFLLCICAVNVVYLRIAYKKHALLARMLSVNLLLGIALSFVALFQILLLVF